MAYVTDSQAYLLLINVACAISIFINGSKLRKYRADIDSQYKAAFIELERRNKELDKYEKWLDKRLHEVETREDRLAQREKEIRFLR